MPRSKTVKGGTKKDADGKHRKETKEERRVRLQRQAEAREACLKIIPYFVGALAFSVLLFAIFVRTQQYSQKVQPVVARDPNIAVNVQQQASGDFAATVETNLNTVQDVKLQDEALDWSPPLEPESDTIEL